VFVDGDVERAYRRVKKTGGKALAGLCPICGQGTRLQIVNHPTTRMNVCAVCDRVHEWPRYRGA